MRFWPLAALPLALPFAFPLQAGSGTEKLAKRVASLSTWREHRSLLATELDSGRHRDAVVAYAAVYAKKNPSDCLAGLSRAYRRWFYLHRVGLETAPPPDEIGSRIRVGFARPAARAALPTLVEAYLFEQLLPPPPFSGDPIRQIRATEPGGRVTHIPVYDGNAALERRKKTLLNLARRAAQVAPNDPEAQYLVAVEMPVSVERAGRIDQLVRRHRDLFGFPGMHTAWSAARAAKSSSAGDLQAEILATLAAMPEGKTKLLMRRLYPMPGVKVD